MAVVDVQGEVLEEGARGERPEEAWEAAPAVAAAAVSVVVKETGAARVGSVGDCRPAEKPGLVAAAPADWGAGMGSEDVKAVCPAEIAREPVDQEAASEAVLGWEPAERGGLTAASA